MTITDPDGRVVLSGPDHGTVDVAHLAPGLYLLMYELGRVRSYARFVKE